MGCETKQLPNGGFMIICRRGERPQKCSACSRPSVALCDYRVIRNGQASTCDSPMCEDHRHRVPGAPNTDWCEGHWNYEQKQAAKIEEHP